MRIRSVALALALTSFLFGCGSKDKDKDKNAAATASALASALGSAATAPSAAASAKPAESAPAKPTKDLPLVGDPAPEFKLVEKPTAADVTAGPVTGSAQGHKFEPKTIYFEPSSEKGWRMTLADKPIAKPTDFTPMGSQAINIDLKEDKLAAGKKLTRAMKYGDGYFQIVQPKDATSTTSWNTDNAWYVEITKWDVKPFDPKASMFQEAGKASGKIYVVFKANNFTQKDGFKHSGVAGTFTDAIVRYKGKPAWEK